MAPVPRTRQASTINLEAVPIDFSAADSASALLAHGHGALHQHVAARLSAALDAGLPQMEVRVRGLSVSAEAVVLRQAEGEPSDAGEHAHHLPTLPNTLRLALSRMSATRQSVRRSILRDVNAVFRPGEMTLVLGHPGSGKSTLLQLISGRFRGEREKHVAVSGSVAYNGVDRTELQHNLPQFVSYVTQRDEHFPVLTVKEVLEYAHAFSGGVSLETFLAPDSPDAAPSTRPQRSESRVRREEAAEEAFRALNHHIPDIVISQLGLQSCQDTIVGDALLRGVSGGERKRVTTGEMEFGLRFVKAMDEISTGLDAAATFDIIRSQRSLARRLKRTILVALLQPPPEVYELFDNVILLKDGEVMYQGPREQVAAHFESLGLVRRPERDEADFLLDIATPKQSHHHVRGAAKIPIEPREFADALHASDMYKAVLHELEEPAGDKTTPDAAEMEQERQRLVATPPFNLTFWEEVKLLARRELLLLWRNQAFVRGRLAMALFVGLFYGSVFYQVDATKVQVKLGVLFSSIQFLGFNQGTNIPQFMSGRPMFYKQRDAHFYRTGSYVLAASVAQVPLILCECFLYGTIVYFMCGLHTAVFNYVIYMLLLILTSLAFAGWFFFLAVASPDMHVAEPFQLLSVVVFIMFAGFMVTRDTLPAYLIWIYWLDPVAWCIRALGVLEYRSGPFSGCVYEGVDYCATYGANSMGEYYLEVYGVPSANGWVYYGIVFMVACYVLCVGLGYRALENQRFDDHNHQPAAPATSTSATVKGEGENEDSYHAVESPRSGRDEAVVSMPRHERNFVPVTLAFKELWYSVRDPKDPKDPKGGGRLDLLKGVSGYACPGQMTALMGASGAGKTTLMDVIAGRKTDGEICGQVLLNGHPASDIAVRRATGYCEQMDIHSDAATFREALTFSAFLRQDASVPKSVKLESVDECLDLLDLRSLADRIVRGSTVEQMKRLTIGVELAAQPSVLFLDEPTSGLDARAAKVIMEGVRKVADTGRTVVCTIHQPSYEVFSLFDMLLLLKRGGQLVYFGELGASSQSLVQYFEAIDGVVPLPPNYNPGTWMLECIGAGVDAASTAESTLAGVPEASGSEGAAVTTDFVALFERSDLHSGLQKMLTREGVGQPAPGIPMLAFESKRAASSATQMSFVVRRFIDQYWRTPGYNLSRFVTSVVLALLFGIMFVGSEFKTYTQVTSGLGMVCVATLFNSLIAMNAVMPTACDDRAPFYRERASQTYNAFWYFVGATLVEVPYCFATTFVFTVITYPMVGFSGFTEGVLFWLALALSVLMSTYIGQLWVYLCPSLDVAAVASVALNMVWFLLMGFNPPAGAIPHGYKWLYTLTPFRYPLSILSSLPFGKCVHDSDVGCRVLQNAPPSVGDATIEQFLATQFNMEYANIGRDFGVTLAFIVGFRLLAALALRFVNHQKR